MILPGARSHIPREGRIERDGSRTRKTDLTAVGVPAEHQVEPSMSGVSINFWGMREQNGKPIVWNVGGRLFDVVDSVIVRVIDSGQIDAVAPARDRLALIEQHPNAHLFETGNHANGVVIA